MLNKIAILVIITPLLLSLPNPAPYIKAAGRPLNIAHRGLCSILPENTL
jgi:glycerophosphoryl diester phosphodiesterase